LKVERSIAAGINIQRSTFNFQHSTIAAPTIGLLVATLLWGCGFTFAKAAGETVNRLSGAGEQSGVGPIWILVARFFIAGVCWLLIFKSARRGWNWQLLWRSLILGGTLTAGMILQHLGLDRTTEAISAFLTTLTILFVPLIMTLVLRKPPAAIVWFGIILAAAGVWLMTGMTGAQFGAGEILSIACAFAYSINIIAVGALVTPQNVWPITAGQFLVTALLCAMAVLMLPHGPAALHPRAVLDLMSHPRIGANVAALGLLVSMGAFGLQFRFQPRMDATRAALLYLVEPIFAAIFAWITIGHGMGAMEIIGAALILLANVLVEVLQARARRVTAAAPIID
jgi:drug/metabolite transporter (DMT)-like permease